MEFLSTVGFIQILPNAQTSHIHDPFISAVIQWPSYQFYQSGGGRNLAPQGLENWAVLSQFSVLQPQGLTIYVWLYSLFFLTGIAAKTVLIITESPGLTLYHQCFFLENAAKLWMPYKFHTSGKSIINTDQGKINVLLLFTVQPKQNAVVFHWFLRKDLSTCLLLSLKSMGLKSALICNLMITKGLSNRKKLHTNPYTQTMGKWHVYLHSRRTINV